MSGIDYEITIFYKINFHLFLALGYFPQTPTGGAHKIHLHPTLDPPSGD